MLCDLLLCLCPSFVYSYGQWPRTPVEYMPKLMDIFAKVLIVALCS